MKKLYVFFAALLFIGVLSMSQSYATMEDGSGGGKVNVSDMNKETRAIDAHECERHPERCLDVRPIKVETKAIDSYECEKYPERCKDEVKVQIEGKALTNEDDKDIGDDDAIDTAQDYNSSRSNRIKSEMGDDCNDYDTRVHPERCGYYPDADADSFGSPNRYERSASEMGDTENNKVEGAKTYNSTRSNRTGGIFIGDNEIEDCKWDPPKCRDELEVRIMESQIKVRTDDTLWCWGRAGSHCSLEVREERREILKERLNVRQAQYNRLQRQLEPRVTRLFERLSEEERDTLSERFASLIEQHQESSNARLLAAILVLQELLETSQNKKGYDYYKSSSDL